MLRILFVIPSLQSGGAERVAAVLLRHLDRTRFDLTLAVVDMRDTVLRPDIPDDVPIVDLQATRVRHALPKLVRLVRRQRPDLLFSTLGHLNVALAMLRPLLPRRTGLVTRETSILSLVPTSFRVPAWFSAAYRLFAGRVDAMVCQSEVMRDDLVANFGFPPAKAIVIHNPVDIARVRSMASQPVDTGLHGVRRGGHIVELVAAGTLTHVKGFDLLIDAVHASSRQVRLTIVGDGPLKSALMMRAAERGGAGRIRFAGFQANPYPYFAGADAFVLSSRFEGFPNVVLEAMTCGTPILATPAPGGLREILEGVEGCTVVRDITSDAIRDGIDGFSFGHSLPAQVVNRFAAAPIAARYADVFSRVAAAR